MRKTQVDIVQTAGLKPLPEIYGIGFCTSTPLTSAEGYRLEQTGRFFNYHFTDKRHDWPIKYTPPDWFKIDGFSPNLNKQLHVGHLRNLAIANSLARLFEAKEMTGGKFIALLGYSLGLEDGAISNLQRWFDLVGYHPEQFSDVEISEQADIQGEPGEGEQAGCEVWKGPDGPVIIRRSDGRPTYAMHDLALCKIVGPDYYLTGSEQRDHFKSLGMAQKHLPMGLVLDPVTGKKMKSRDGTAFGAAEALKLTMDKIGKTYMPEELAWNVLAWNFLRVSRDQDVKFDIDEWTKPDSQGLYVTYTYARIGAAIMRGAMANTWKPEGEKLEDADVKLMGFANYMPFYKQRAVQTLDPSPLANFASDLAKKLGSTYHAERIADGRPALQFAVKHAYKVLGDTMLLLGMYPITDV